MEMVNFDSLAYSKRLASHGFTSEQADALAEEQANLINSQLATKYDLKKVEASLKRDMKEIEASLKRDMKEIEATLKTDIELVRRDMKELEMRLTVRLGGMMVTSVFVVTAVFAAIVKLL